MAWGAPGPRVVAAMTMVVVMVGHSDVSLYELGNLARQVGPKVLQGGGEPSAKCYSSGKKPVADNPW